MSAHAGRVAVRGADLMVEIIGADGPAFVWCHGLMSSRAHEDQDGLFDWSAVVEQRWRWVRYDARGHGESRGTNNVAAYSWGELGRDLVGLADALGIPRFAAGGASMGCATVIEAALAAPDRIDRLVLVTPPAAWENHAAVAEHYRTNAAYVRSQGDDEGLLAVGVDVRPPILMSMPNSGSNLPAVHPDLLPAVLRGAAASDLPSADQLAQLQQPALILAWDTDPAHPLGTAEALAEILPRADLHVARTLRQIRDWPRLVSGFMGLA
ncbi:MAG TPA: alpha/beta fold hydrolase [Acidimicrobiales bacterium]|nr:alpha/beta fold hydrolase [Acidimicrobiales bacterium]